MNMIMNTNKENDNAASDAAPDTTAPEPAVTVPSLLGEDGAFAPDWYARFDDLQPYAATLAKFKRPEALAKSYAHLEKLKGYPDAQDDPRMQAFRITVGLPENPDDFTIARPDDTPDEIWDEHLAQSLSRVAFDYGVPPKAMQALVDSYSREGRNFLMDCRKREQDAIDAAEADLQNEWGNEFDHNMQTVASFLKHVGDQTGIDVQSLVENPALRANADFARLVFAMAEQGREAPIRQGVPADDKQEAQRIASDPTHPLHEAYMHANHPRHRYANEQYDRLAFGRSL